MELYNLFSELAHNGEELSESEISTEYQNWLRQCESAIASTFGRNSEESKAFRRGYDRSSKIMALKALAAKSRGQSNKAGITFINNINQNQLVTVKNEFSLSILLNIDHSDLNDEDKEKAKQLFNEVKSEIEKQETNWDKVKDLLKKSFDYGLKIAPDIVKLADAYYRAKHN